MILIGLINLFVIASIIYWIYKSQNWPLKPYYFPAILIKLVAGIGVGVVYQYWYDGQGDTFSFYREAVVISDYLFLDPIRFLNFLAIGNDPPAGLIFLDQPRALFFSKLVALIRIFSFGDYWVISLYLSLFSFTGLWILANRICTSFGLPPWIPAVSFLVAPSVIFWSAGMLKEAVALGAIGYIVGWMIHSTFTGRWPISRTVVILLLFLLLAQLKYYTAAMLLAVLFSILITHAIIKGSSAVATSSFSQAKFWLLIFVVLILVATSLHPNLYPQNFLGVLVANHDLTLNSSLPANSIHYWDLAPSIGSVLINLPWAVFSALFRPFVLEATNLLQFLAALENLLILVVAIAALGNVKKAFTSQFTIWILGILVYVVMGCGLIALSTPNLGTLARYKVMFLPFLLVIVLMNNPLINRLGKRDAIGSKAADKIDETAS